MWERVRGVSLWRDCFDQNESRYGSPAESSPLLESCLDIEVRKERVGCGWNETKGGKERR